MALTDFFARTDHDDLLDAAADIESVLDLDGRVLDFSPAFRRLMYEFEEAVMDLVVRAIETRRPASDGDG